MKLLKIVSLLIAAAAVIFLTIGCSSNSSATTAVKTQTATAQKGNISVSVTGTGNLALEYTQELSFGQTGLVSQASNAKIAEVLVQPGDTVKQGQVLVKADTTDWQDQITQDQYALDNAQANLLNAQNNLATDKMKLSQQSDVQKIQNEIDNTNTQLQTAQAMLQQAMVSSSPYAGSEVQYWNQAISQYQADIATYQKQMSDLLADPEHYLATQVNGSAASVAAIKNLQMQIEQDQASITQQQNAVDQAQTNLDNDKAQPQEITAPYDGLITQVNVNQGDIVQRNANLIEIAEPDKFIANILVTEMDVMSLKIGEEATVSFDALSGLNFPAKITQIAPTATVQQGVVNYQVTVELTSLTPVQTAHTATDPASSLTGASQNISLKDGLSATVTIVTQQQDNVLLVPSRAIKNSTVQVVNGTSTETVRVQTGLTNGTDTEITSGLQEGEKVLISSSTTTTSSSNTGVRGGPGLGGIRIP